MMVLMVGSPYYTHYLHTWGQLDKNTSLYMYM